MSYDSSTLMTPTTTAQQQVVNELQCLLDQTSQNSMISMNETKPQLTLGPTNFMGQNIGNGNCSMDVSSSFQQQLNVGSPPLSQQSSSPGTLYSELNNQRQHHQQQLSPTINNSTMNPFQTPTTSTIPQMIQCTMSQSVDSQGLLSSNMMCPSTTAADSVSGVINCLAQSIMKTEPVSPIYSASRQTITQPMANMNLMGEDLQANQGSFANAITQLSDNELLNYINPSCFDQGSF